MRTEWVSQPLSAEEPQFSTTPTASCHPHTCNNNNNMQGNLALILIIFLTAVICGVSLYAAIRCCLPGRLPQTMHEQKKPTHETPIVVYTSDLKLAGAEPECNICLAEFEQGDEIQVLTRCNHGFHLLCVQQWLSSRTSCPTCRTTLFPSTPTLKDTAADQ